MGEGKGIKVQAAMAWLFAVLFLKRALTLPPIPASLDPTYFGGGSPNMKGLFCLCWYVYEVLRLRGQSGGGSAWKTARMRLLNFFRGQEACHGHGEPFSASHGQLWLAIYAIALYVASVLVRDEEVLAGAREWNRFEYAAYTIGERKGDPWLPGGRGVMTNKETGEVVVIGSGSMRSEWLVAVREGRDIGRANQYDMGATAMARVPEGIRAEIVTWPSAFPPTWSPWHGRRYSNGNGDEHFCSWFDEPPFPWKDSMLSAGFDGELWISPSVDRERIDATGVGRELVLSIDTPLSEVPERERRRHGR